MPLARLNGAEINYEVIGQTGPWVATISSGRQSLAKLEDVACAVAARGYRVVMHDRRNCGQSTLDFATLAPEEDTWANDLHALLENLHVDRAFVIGLSRGARIAMRFALRYPETTSGLLLWGVSGGKLAARHLEEYYYDSYLRACRAGGMEAVCVLGHFAGLVEARAQNLDTLLAIDPAEFMSAMQQWKSHFLIGVKNPVMGLSDDELSTIRVPTAIVPYYDRLHPRESAIHAHQAIPGSRLFDLQPDRWEREGPAGGPRDKVTVARIFCAFERSLRTGKPLPDDQRLKRDLLRRPGPLVRLARRLRRDLA